MASLSRHFTSSACQSKSHVHVYTTVYLLLVLVSEMFDFEFFRVLSKNRYPGIEYFIVLSSPEILALLFLLEEVKLHLSPPRPDRKMIKRLTFEII